MGRKPYSHVNLPPRMRKRVQRSGKIYYYYEGTDRKECALGPDFILALQQYAELHIIVPADLTRVKFDDAADRYETHIIPRKAPKTQEGNLQQLKGLRRFFKGAPLDEIKPQHIRQYLDKRLKSPVAANREIALFSDIFNHCREWGWTAAANPANGIKRFREKGRGVYVDEAQFKKLWDAADVVVRDFADLLYLTGQRPGDVNKMSENDIKDGELWVTQGKTGTKLRISIVGELARVIERIRERKKPYKVYSRRLIVNESGMPITYRRLVKRFRKAREAAGVTFQLRDLRARALTDKDEQMGARAAQELGGHASMNMTENYIRPRKGKLVQPLKGKDE